MPISETQTSLPMAGLMPHAPVLIPAIAGSRSQKVHDSIHALRTLSQRLLQSQPHRVILLSPHSPRRPNAFGLWTTHPLAGSFDQFRHPEITVQIPNDIPFCKEFRTQAGILNLNLWEIHESPLDHGAMVPLHFLLEAGWHGPAVVVGLNSLPDTDLENLGRCLAKTIERIPGHSVLVASGDMSHRLTETAPGGFHPHGHDFDTAFVNIISQGKFSSLTTLDPKLRSRAAEDVVDATRVAVATLDHLRQPARNYEVLSYQGPFGVGYTVAVLHGNHTHTS